MNLLKRQRDAIGLSTFTNKLDFHSPNRTTQRHYSLLYYELDKLLKVNAINQAPKIKKKLYFAISLKIGRLKFFKLILRLKVRCFLK